MLGGVTWESVGVGSQGGGLEVKGGGVCEKVKEEMRCLLFFYI